MGPDARHLVTQSWPTLCNLPGYSVHGILQAKILEWLPFPAPGDIPDRHPPCLLHRQVDSLPLNHREAQHRTWEHSMYVSVCIRAELLQSRPTLCYPTDHSSPDSCVQGILEARTLEWVSMPSSRGSSWLRDLTCVFLRLLHWQAVLYHQYHLGSLS